MVLIQGETNCTFDGRNHNQKLVWKAWTQRGEEFVITLQSTKLGKFKL